MKIKVKLFLAIGVLLGIMLLSQGYSIMTNKQEQASYGEMFDDFEVSLLLKSTQYRITGISNDERAYLLKGDEEFVRGISSKSEELHAYFAELKRLAVGAEEQQLVQQIEEKFNAFMEASNRVAEAYKAGNRAEALDMHFGKEREVRKELDELVDTFLSEVESEVKQDIVQRKNEMSRFIALLLVISAVSVTFGLIVGFLIIRSIVKPLQQVNVQLREIAEGEGDLTRELSIKTKDEIGDLSQSFNKMIGSLRSLIHQVRSNAEQVAASSEELTASAEQTSRATEQIAHTIQRVAEGTEHQVKSTGESSKAVQELSIGVEQVAGNAQSASSTAIHTSEMALEGNRAVQTAVTQMNSINGTIHQLAEVVKGLGERSQEIGQIVEVIGGIAAQTNLLALNAAIEAARAGEHGRGFAVVADEVRKLAEQSSQSALQIAELITAIQAETNQAVQSMESGKKEVEEGIGVVSKAGETFAQIQLSVQNVATQIEEVSAAAQQMSANTTQVVGSINLITEVAQESAAGTQEVSAAAEEQLASMEEIATSAASLSRMAEELQALIGRFKV